MWLPMLANFINTLSLVLFSFGAWQRREPYLGAYLGWAAAWIAWNVFLVAYYAEAGGLRRTQDLLSFGTGSFSWWLANGYGCRPEYASLEPSATDILLPVRPSRVTGCLLEYHSVEVLQAAAQMVLTVAAAVSGAILLFRLRLMRRLEIESKTIYSIEYSPTSAAETSTTALYANTAPPAQEHPRVMTPRRVKRRSCTRSSARSARGVSGAPATGAGFGRRSAHHNASVRSNPINRLMSEAAAATTTAMSSSNKLALQDSSTSNDEAGGAFRQQQEVSYGQVNPAYDFSRPNSIYSSNRPPSALTSYSNFHGQRSSTANHKQQQPLITQDALIRGGVGGGGLSDSDDDLPPPPPPHELTGATSATASTLPQIPVPQQRAAVARKNEYVNMPIDSSTLRADNHVLNQNGRDEDDYGFAGGVEQQQQSDKWYLKDSMRPVGAPAHGGNCKCYRCQRKLTAI